MATNRISPCLWFDNQAEEAARFYTSIFKNSEILRTSHYTDAGREVPGQEPGPVMTVEFELDGQKYTALNGGPIFKFNEAVSLMILCDTQDEIDYYWEKLTPGGDPKAQQCGWLKDKYGVSWQVVPKIVAELMATSDEEKAGRVMEAMLPMKKIDIAELENAAAGHATANT
jgi:predicted 3-demethylubiquinone-9 3-methyltransferase (glyoxalase superfamily)